jgi:filamentous hemagglutinin family protein
VVLNPEFEKGIEMTRDRRSMLAGFTSCLRLRVMRMGRRCGLALARVRVPAPSRLLVALLAAGGVAPALAGGALPTGGRVVSGGVTIGTPHDNSLDIVQTTARGVVDWQSFDVGAGEQVNFLQPGRTSSTLNRIVGNDASEIFGEINATGQVFLINQNGIVFAPGASINVGGLVASTLQISDSDYLAGHYVFTGSGGRVDNQGSIRAGFAALVGGQVTNEGSIATPGGTTALAAGGRVTMGLPGSDLVSVSVDAPTAAALVRSGGIVQADGGQVLMTAKATDALLATVINVDGLVQARSVGMRDGTIVLDGGTSGVVSVSGTLDASGKAAGQTGGTVKALGEEVALFGQARVDASGDAGGGMVRLGGDWHGAGADGDRNAAQVFDGAGTTIAADALTRGQGGNVVLWSDHQTQVYGAISAAGGRAAGDGGAIETSSHETLVAQGSVSAGAAHGNGGLWLLDPDNITITTQQSTITEDGNHVWQSQVNANVNNIDLSKSLVAGTRVIVRTSSTTIHNGSITVDAPVTTPNLTAGQSGTLELDAQGNIVFTKNGSIIAGAGTGLEVDLNAGVDGNGSGVAGTLASVITMDRASSINTGSASFTATARDGITLAGFTAGGDATITNTNRDGFVQFVGTDRVTGGLDVSSGGGDILQTAGTVTAVGHVDFESGGGDITQSGGKLVSNGPASFDAIEGDLALPSATNVFGAGVSAFGDSISLRASGALAISSLEGTTNNDPIDLGGNLVLVAGAGLTLVPTGAISAPNITLSAGAALTVGNALDAGSVLLTGTSVAITKAIDATSNLGITASAAGISESGAGAIASSATTELTAAGAINLTSGTNTFGGLVTINDTGGATTITAASGNLQAALTTAATTLTATAGDVTVTGGTSHGLTLAGKNIHLATATTLGVTGNLKATLSALGTVDEQKAVTVSGTTTVDSKGGTIRLGQANRFTNGITALGANVTLADSKGLKVNGLSASGLNTLAFTALGGAVTLPAGAISAASSFSLTQSVPLTTANAVSSSTLTLEAPSVVVATALTAPGSLSITATGGDITEQGAGVITAVGTSVFSATGDIDLGNGNNVLSRITSASTTGGDITLDAKATMQLDSIGATHGNLVIDVTGASSGILETGSTLNVSGTTTLTAAGGNITLTGSNNTFGGLLTVNDSAGSTTTVAAKGNLGAVFNTGTTTASATGNLTGTFNSGTTTATAGNALVATLATTGTTMLTATAGDATVARGTSQALTVTGKNVHLATTGTLGVTGALSVSLASPGTINEQKALTVSGVTTVVDIGGTIALGGTNRFTGGITANGANVTLADTQDLLLNGVGPNVANLTLTARAGQVLLPATVDVANAFSLTQSDAFASTSAITAPTLALKAPSVAVSGALSSTDSLSIAATSGDITDQGAGVISAGGAVDLTAASGAIDLDNLSSMYAGPLSMTAQSVTLRTHGGLDLQDVTAPAFDLEAGGDIVQTGTSAIDAGAGTLASNGAVTLDNSGNVFSGHLTLAAASVDVFDSTNLGTSVRTSGGDAMLVSAQSLTVDGSVDGVLTATAQQGSITFGTNASGTTTAARIVADAASNITQAAALTLTDGATFTAGAAGLIQLQSANHIQGEVGLAAQRASFSNTGATAVDLATTGDAAITAVAGALTARGSTGAGHATLTGAGVHLGTTDADGALVVGTLTATSTGGAGIDQAGEVRVAGTSTLDAGGADIALGTDTSRNSFGGTVSARDAGAVAIGATGDLSVDLAGVATASLHAGGAATVAGATTGDLGVAGASQVTAGALDVGGAFTATSGGGIDQSGTSALTVGGASTLTSAGEIDLGGANSFGGTVSVKDSSALSVTLNAIGQLDVGLDTHGTTTLTGGAVDFAAASTVNGDLIVASTGQAGSQNGERGGRALETALGDIVQATDLTVTGATTLSATGNITLDRLGNTFDKTVTASGQTVDIGAKSLDVKIASAHAATLESAGALTIESVSPPAGSTTTGDFIATADQGSLVLVGTLTWHGHVSLTGDGIFGSQSADGGAQPNATIVVDAGDEIDLDPRQGTIGHQQNANTGEDEQLGLLLGGASGELDSGGNGGIHIAVPPGATGPYFFSLRGGRTQGDVSIDVDSTLKDVTFICTSANVCTSESGEILFITNAAIDAVLTQAAEDARDAAYGTDNLDHAIRRGFVTKFGRVAPDVDRIEAGLGDVQCDPRITSETSILANRACNVSAEKPKSPSPALDTIQPLKN